MQGSCTLPEPCHSPSLNLTQRSAAAKEQNSTDNGSGGKRLEEGPARVVEEEDALHGDNATEEETVGHGAGAHGLGGMVNVGTQHEPRAQEHRQCRGNGKSEECRDDLWW